jgi:hypothetical protein
MSKLSKCLQNQDAPENPEKYQVKAHFLVSFVVYNIIPFYVSMQTVEVLAKPGCSREPRKIPNESPFSAEFRGI